MNHLVFTLSAELGHAPYRTVSTYTLGPGTRCGATLVLARPGPDNGRGAGARFSHSGDITTSGMLRPLTHQKEVERPHITWAPLTERARTEGRHKFLHLEHTSLWYGIAPEKCIESGTRERLLVRLCAWTVTLLLAPFYISCNLALLN